jgi:hypothetical protein
LAQRLDIPAQDARAALMALCLKAGCAFALSTEPGRTYRANAVSGTMSWQDALKRLLAGTGLRYEIADHASVRVWADARATTPRVAPTPEAPVHLDEVTITAAFVAGIEDSLLQKRRADAIVDAVSAGRIGELPAANLAEALQRVPGVAIEREVGEGQFVSVRGLGPLFQSVTLNGAPVAFNENIRNSTQSGRQFRFRALSADLLAGAVVAKSPTADLVDGGIGSNIDIRTVRGLEGPSYLSIRADAHAEVRSDAVSPDIAISGRWRRADERLGVVAGVSTERREVQYDRFQVSRYRDFVIGGRSLTVPEDIRTTVEQEQRARTTAFVGAEWRVAPSVTLYLDALASRFDNGIREDRVVYTIGDYAPQAVAAGDARIENGVLTGGRIAAGQIGNNLEVSDQVHDNVSLSLAVKADAGAWNLEPRLSLSSARSNLDTPLQRIGAVSPLGVAYVFDLGPDLVERRKAPLLSTSFDLTDPRQLTFSRYGVRATQVEDHDVTGLIAAERPVDWTLGPLRIERLRLGGQVTDRGRDFQRRDREAAPGPHGRGPAGLLQGRRADPGRLRPPGRRHHRARLAGHRQYRRPCGADPDGRRRHAAGRLGHGLYRRQAGPLHRRPRRGTAQRQPGHRAGRALAAAAGGLAQHHPAVAGRSALGDRAGQQPGLASLPAWPGRDRPSLARDAVLRRRRQSGAHALSGHQLRRLAGA